MPPDLTANHDLARWLIAFAGAAAISIAAWRARSLSTSGMIAAAVLGTVLVGAAGWWAGALLVAFFVTSSFLSRLGQAAQENTLQRGSRRDTVQVAANGGIALVCAIAYGLTGDAPWLAGLAGSLAAANADTWSTEIGGTSPTRPRLITTGERVPAGTSGAVSRRGLAGAIGGALLVASFAGIGVATGWLDLPGGPVASIIAVTLAGLAGSLVDSLLGATVQDRRWCDSCNKETERKVHRCGTTTRSTGGLSWVTNDIVNLACITSGAILAAILTTMLA